MPQVLEVLPVPCRGRAEAHRHQVRRLLRRGDRKPDQRAELRAAPVRRALGRGHPRNRRHRRKRPGIADLLGACIKGPQLSGDFWRVIQTCHGRFDQQVNDGIAKLSTPDPATGLSPLGAVYAKIRREAPNARIVVVGYPKFFTAQSSGGIIGCNFVWPVDQVWMNAKIKQFDDAIENQAHALRAEYASGAEAFTDGHELCDSGTPFLNGLINRLRCLRSRTSRSTRTWMGTGGSPTCFSSTCAPPTRRTRSPSARADDHLRAADPAGHGNRVLHHRLARVGRADVADRPGRAHVHPL